MPELPKLWTKDSKYLRRNKKPLQTIQKNFKLNRSVGKQLNSFKKSITDSAIFRNSSTPQLFAKIPSVTITKGERLNAMNIEKGNEHEIAKVITEEISMENSAP
jgi:hypothetical protein